MPIFQTNGTQQQCGYALGVICLDDYLPYIPGDLNNASTFNYPMLYRAVEGLHFSDLAAEPPIANDAMDRLVAVAQELEAAGVRAITSNCAYLNRYRHLVSRAVKVPVALSSLVQLPLIAGAAGPEKTIGIIGAIAPTPDQLYSGSVSEIRIPNPLVCYGLQDQSAFAQLLAGLKLNGDGDSPLTLDPTAICADVVRVAERLVADHPDTGAIVLDHPSLPPYAYAVQQATGRPVYDITTLIDLLYAGTHPARYQGHL